MVLTIVNSSLKPSIAPTVIAGEKGRYVNAVETVAIFDKTSSPRKNPKKIIEQERVLIQGFPSALLH